MAEPDPSPPGHTSSCETPAGVGVSERGSPCYAVFRKVPSAVSGSPEQKTPKGPDITPSVPLPSSAGVGLLETQPSPSRLARGLAGQSLSFTLGHHFCLFKKNLHCLARAMMLWGVTTCFPPPVMRPFGEVWRSHVADNTVPLSFPNDERLPELTPQHGSDAAAAT